MATKNTESLKMDASLNLIGQTVGDTPGYTILSMISQGGFAEVYQARSLATGKQFAVKILFPTKNNFIEFYQEVGAYELLSSTKTSTSVGCEHHIVCLENAFIQQIDGRDYYILVLELMDDDFWAVILSKRPATSAELMLHYMKTLLTGLSYIHSKGIAQNDIKPGNLLVNPDLLRVKYADFGFSCTDETQPLLYGTKAFFIEALLQLEESPFDREGLEIFETSILQDIATDLGVFTPDPDLFSNKKRFIRLLSGLKDPPLDERILDLSIPTLRTIAHALNVLEPDEYRLLKCGIKGTPEYLSPDYLFLEGAEYMTLELAQKDDIWALGIVFRFMTEGRKILPFVKVNEVYFQEDTTVPILFETIRISAYPLWEDETLTKTQQQERIEAAKEPILYDTGNPRLDTIVIDVIEQMSAPWAENRPTARQLLDYIEDNR